LVRTTSDILLVVGRPVRLKKILGDDAGLQETVLLTVLIITRLKKKKVMRLILGRGLFQCRILPIDFSLSFYPLPVFFCFKSRYSKERIQSS